MPLVRKEKHCKLAFLQIKVTFFHLFSNKCVKLGVGSACGSATVDANPDQDRHQNGSSDPDQRQNDADPQHWKFKNTLGRMCDHVCNPK